MVSKLCSGEPQGSVGQEEQEPGRRERTHTKAVGPASLLGLLSILYMSFLLKFPLQRSVAGIFHLNLEATVCASAPQCADREVEDQVLANYRDETDPVSPL